MRVNISTAFDYGRKSGIHCGPEGISQPFEFPKRLSKDEVFLKESWSIRVEEQLVVPVDAEFSNLVASQLLNLHKVHVYKGDLVADADNGDLQTLQERGRQGRRLKDDNETGP